MVKLLFRLDAGHNLGIGNLHRSLSLAVALGKLGAQGIFLTNANNASSKLIRAFNFYHHSLDLPQSWDTEDAIQTIRVSTMHDCDAIILDSHEVSSEYVDELRSAGFFVIMRDDLAASPFTCQMVINGNAGAKTLPYTSKSEDTSFLLGLKYMVLGQDFWDLPVYREWCVVKKVLLTLGGGDQHRLMPGLIGMLDKCPGDFSIIGVIGPYFENTEEINSAARAAHRPVKLVRSPRSLCTFMQNSDLAISAGGQTLYELARSGCPTIATQVASNQKYQLQALGQTGFLQGFIDAGDKDFWDIIRESATRLLSDPATRQQLGSTGKQLVDGQGAQRVSEAITQSLTS